MRLRTAATSTRFRRQNDTGRTWRKANGPHPLQGHCLTSVYYSPMISEAQAHKYCREPLDKIEGYAIAISSPETYEVHHRFGELASTATLKEMHYYYGRPACELIFIPRVLHLKLHHLGHPMKESSKELLRAKRLGQTMPAQARASIKAGVLRHLQEHPEVREKLREVWRGRKHSPETISKMKQSASTRGDEYRKKNSVAVKKAEQLEVAAYREYKTAGGPLKWSAWRHFYKTKKEDQCVV